MKNRIKRGVTLSLSLCALFSAFSFGASAQRQEYTSAEQIEEQATYDMLARVELGLLPVGNKSVNAYRGLAVKYGGAKLNGGISIGGRAYISLREFARAVGATYSYDASARCAVVRYGSFVLSVNDGAYVMYANYSRPIFSFANSVLMSDGEVYSPLDSLVRAFGLRSESTSGGVSISGSPKPMSQKADYTEDEVFWLARIIQAESSGESLLGKIGVGSVVMNRVASPLYPNTIYGVIFDRNYGVQFSPILNGTIYNTPNYQSRLAAMICLEGFRISDRALFFLEPRLATSSWIPRNREYLFSILHHDFYA